MVHRYDFFLLYAEACSFYNANFPNMFLKFKSYSLVSANSFLIRTGSANNHIRSSRWFWCINRLRLLVQVKILNNNQMITSFSRASCYMILGHFVMGICHCVLCNTFWNKYIFDENDRCSLSKLSELREWNFEYRTLSPVERAPRLKGSVGSKPMD